MQLYVHARGGISSVNTCNFTVRCSYLWIGVPVCHVVVVASVRRDCGCGLRFVEWLVVVWSLVIIM